MTLRNIFFNTILFVSTFAAAAWLPAESPLTISVDTKQPGAEISPDFPGLSFELSQLTPGENGARYFRPDNQPLITLFQTLGIKSLRVGGNTADRNFRRQPDTADLDSLFTFAKAAGVKVIYCLRLHDGDPSEDAKTAKYIMDHYRDQIACFSIGQEPSAYPKVTNPIPGTTKTKVTRPSYTDYAKKWKAFEEVIAAAAPDARFCGPSVEANPSWERQFMTEFGHGYHVTMITAHSYPGSAGNRVPTPEIGRDEMLSDRFISAYQKLYDGFASTALTDGFPYRLEEVNNFFNGGATEVSDTFASTLWGLDFMYWWASHGAAGLNFHTGDKVAAGADMRPSRYTAYYTTHGGFSVRPLGYGIKAFDIGAHGRMLQATIANPQNLNVTAYAVLGNDKIIYLTVINKEHNEQGKDADVTLTVDAGWTDPQILSLAIPGGDVAAKTGMTLGGADINNDGTWNGKWTPLTVIANALKFKIPAASASIVKLKMTE